MRLALTAALILAPVSALAQTLMTADEFEAYATGKTLSYAESGAIYGSEEYLPGRKVRWAFTEDECKFGTYYEQNVEICFVYDDDPLPKCWEIWQDGAGLSAIYIEGDTRSAVSEVQQTNVPLSCAGPDVGV